MSKLSFRARALDASKPMPIYMAEELPDLPDYSAINRAVPQMPSGMEKEEECEHHLQRAICAGLIIPTPEVATVEDAQAYDKVYPANYKQPRQLIHMQPFAMEQDIPDYDMDSEDERWLMSQAKKLDINPLKFEEMMDRLEKSSGQTVVTINEAKALLKEDDDLIIAVFDYWLNKRLKTQHPLILSVKTEHRAGSAANNPYLAFRRRTEKMQTRKNRKNDETSYEKMLKLRRDLSRAVTLLELVKRREKTKREYVHLTVEVFEKRYQARDFSGALVAEVATVKRPAFTPLFQNHYAGNQTSWRSDKASVKDDLSGRKEKRQYKKRKHKSSHMGGNRISSVGLNEGLGSSEDEEMLPEEQVQEEAEEEGQFAFRRNKLCNYHMPITNGDNVMGGGLGATTDKRHRYTLTSLSYPRRKCIGFARRRVGRGGRIVLDRIATDYDDLWRTLDWNILDSGAATTPATTTTTTTVVKSEPQALPPPLLLQQQQQRTNPLNVNASTVSSVDSETSGAVVVGGACGLLNVFSNGGGAGDSAGTSDVATMATTVVNIVDVAKRNQRLDDEETLRASADWTEPKRLGYEYDKKERDEMVEFLKEVRRDWLHFRPKTPPSYYEPPCHMVPVTEDADSLVFLPASSTALTMEVESLEPTSDATDSLFVTTPFSLDDLYRDCYAAPDEPPLDSATFGCSRFNVTDSSNATNSASCLSNKQEAAASTSSSSSSTVAANTSILSSTLTSPKLNSVNSAVTPPTTTASGGGGSAGGTGAAACTTTTMAATNGPMKLCGSPSSATNHKQLFYGKTVASSGAASTTTTTTRRGNKMHQNAYNTSARAPQSPRPALSAHTLTLNSHSANILEIPSLSNCDTDSTTSATAAATKLNSSTCTPDNSNSTGGGGGGSAATSNTKNNSSKQQQQQTIVRKNNLVMEVT